MVWGSGFGVWGLGFGIWVSGFEVQGLGFGVQGFGCKVQCSRLRAGRGVSVCLQSRSLLVCRVSLVLSTLQANGLQTRETLRIKSDFANERSWFVE